MVILKELLKLFKYLDFSGIYIISRWLDLLFKVLHKERNSHKAWKGPWLVVILSLSIDIWHVDFS